MTVGGGELRVPAARACWRGGMVLQYSEGTLGLGLGPVGLIMRSRARATGEDKRDTGGGAGWSSGKLFSKGSQFKFTSRFLPVWFLDLVSFPGAELLSFWVLSDCVFDMKKEFILSSSLKRR